MPIAPPHPFAQDTYSAWHKTVFPADNPLVEKVEQLRAELAASSRPLLAVLVQILNYAADYSRFEYSQAAKTSTKYDISLSHALPPKAPADAYDLLFKSTVSIINKLWRKNNQAVPEVHLGNIKQHITDLVRTDITATTLDSARFLAARLNALPGIIYHPKMKKTYDNTIASV